VFVVCGQFGLGILAAVGAAGGEGSGYRMDGVADAIERLLAVGPAKQVVAFGSTAAAGFDEGEAGEQAPIEVMGIRFSKENRGVILRGAVLFLEKPVQDGFPDVELSTNFRDVLTGVGRGGGDTQDSREKHNTGGQKALHDMSFSLEINFRWNGLFGAGRNGERQMTVNVRAYEKL
jgi:hypothetical protein